MYENYIINYFVQFKPRLSANSCQIIIVVNRNHILNIQNHQTVLLFFDQLGNFEQNYELY